MSEEPTISKRQEQILSAMMTEKMAADSDPTKVEGLKDSSWPSSCRSVRKGFVLIYRRCATLVLSGTGGMCLVTSSKKAVALVFRAFLQGKSLTRTLSVTQTQVRTCGFTLAIVLSRSLRRTVIPTFS